jgi:hypothetical protein
MSTACRSKLRKSGTRSITLAFSALLAIKILSELIEVRDFINPGPLVAYMTAESRGLVLWNDRLDQRSQFPAVIGNNYAFSIITTQVPLLSESAKKESVVLLFNRIKKVAQRVCNDIEFRSHMVHGMEGSDTGSFCRGIFRFRS